MPKNAPDDEQEEMFPELDMKNPQHKSLVRAAKAYHKAKKERSALLTTSKENVAAKAGAVRELMVKCSLTHVHFKGLDIEVIPGESSVVVKTQDEESEDESSEE